MTDTPEQQKRKAYIEQAEGRVKKAAGELLDDPELKRQGAIKDIKGRARERIADVRKKYKR